VFGSCHTPIEAHRKCLEAIDDRELALCEANKKIDVITDDAAGKHTQRILEQAKDELDFLNDCRLRLEQHIGYVPKMKDYQTNQQQEWRLELEHRAENNLLCTGNIPVSDFSTMRMHPEFNLILARIGEIKEQMNLGLEYQFTEPSWKSETLLLDQRD
jgi:hypothetical protein